MNPSARSCTRGLPCKARPPNASPLRFPSRLRVRPTVCKAPPLQCLGAAGAVASRTDLGLASPSYGKHKLRSVLLRFRQHKAHIPPLAPVKRGRGVGGEGEHSPCKHTNQAIKIALQRARAGKPELRETQTGEPAGLFQNSIANTTEPVESQAHPYLRSSVVQETASQSLYHADI